MYENEHRKFDGSGSAVCIDVGHNTLMIGVARQSGLKFDWNGSANVSMGIRDVSRVCQVLRGMLENAFDESTRSQWGAGYSADAIFRKIGKYDVAFTHLVEPTPGYRLIIKGEGSAGTWTYFFDMDEAFMLMIGLERAFSRIMFGI